MPSTAVGSSAKKKSTSQFGDAHLIPKTYDALFKKYGTPDIPKNFLKALAWSESRFNPKAKSPSSSCTGLFQIMKGTLDDFNKANGTKLSMSAMTDPKANTRVACWHLRTIINTYKERVPALLSPDWTKLGWVSLLVLGWGAGWSPVGGVIQIVDQLLRTVEPDKITLDTVIQAAGVLHPKSTIYADPKLRDADGYGPYMSDPTLRTYVLATVQRFYTLGGAGTAAAAATAEAPAGSLSTEAASAFVGPPAPPGLAAAVKAPAPSALGPTPAARAAAARAVASKPVSGINAYREFPWGAVAAIATGIGIALVLL